MMNSISLELFAGIFGLVCERAIDPTYADRYDRQIICTLSRAFHPRRFIEFGVNEGRTAELVLRTSPWINHYLGVDVLSFFVPVLKQQLSEIPKDNQHGRYVRDHRFELLLLPHGTQGIHADQLGAPADMIYIDADHSYDGVARDTQLARDILPASGGCIIWHDYHRDLPGVVHYLAEQASNGHNIVNVVGTRICFEVVR